MAVIIVTFNKSITSWLLTVINLSYPIVHHVLNKKTCCLFLKQIRSWSMSILVHFCEYSIRRPDQHLITSHTKNAIINILNLKTPIKHGLYLTWRVVTSFLAIWKHIRFNNISEFVVVILVSAPRITFLSRCSVKKLACSSAWWKIFINNRIE